MSPENATNERDGLRGQILYLRSIAIGLTVADLVLLILLSYVLVRERTFIVPPEVRRPYELGSNFANKEYLLDQADYVLSKVLTTSPELVDHHNKTILNMAHPDGYGTLKTALDAAALRIRKDRITTIWVPKKEEVSEKALRVKVTGLLKTYITDKLTSEREKEYLVEFTITTSGRLYVSKIEEVVKRDTFNLKPIGN
jgi:conjugal transfer pilus assembly protein TraE